MSRADAECIMATFLAGLIAGIMATLTILYLAMQLPLHQPGPGDPEA